MLDELNYCLIQGFIQHFISHVPFCSRNFWVVLGYGDVKSGQKGTKTKRFFPQNVRCFNLFYMFKSGQVKPCFGKSS